MCMILWLSTILGSAGAAPPPAAQRLALVIGNATYAALPPLPACTASAHAAAAALRRAGFDVTERLDLTNGQMGAALAELAETAAKTPGKSVAVYVCGYVVGFDNRAFLLPVSASIERDTDVLTQGLVAKSVVDAVRRSGARAGLVLLDAVAKPAGDGRLSLDTLTAGTPEGSVAVAAASTDAAPPAGATPLATALSTALTLPEIEAGDVLRTLQQRLAGASGTRLAVAPAAEPAWLAGGPAAVAAPPPQAPPPPAPPPAVPPVSSPPAALAAPSAANPPAAAPAQAVTQASPADAAAAFPDEEHMAVGDRRRVQTALLHLGYYDRQVDGVFGPETRAAIRRFQHEIGADMTGRITPEQAGRLIADGR